MGIRLLLIAILLGVFNTAFAQTNKKPQSQASAITVLCTTAYIEPKTITIWWAEDDYRFPARIQDGFNGNVYLGQTSANNFRWDRGQNIATLDRYSGILTLTPKNGDENISAKCKKVEKQF